MPHFPVIFLLFIFFHVNFRASQGHGPVSDIQIPSDDSSPAFARTTQHARAHHPTRECYRRPLSAVCSRAAGPPHCAHLPPLSAERTIEICHPRLVEGNLSLSPIFRVTAWWISSLQSGRTWNPVIRPLEKFRK